MDGDTIIRLVNPTDQDYVDFNGDRRYRIPANGEIVVQAAPLHEWLGDPDLRDDGRNQWRRQEFLRLRARYGAYENDELWERNKPKIQAWTTDGQRLLTIVDDPTGVPALVDHGSDTTGVADTIRNLQSQITQLQAAAAGTSTLSASDPSPLGPPPAPKAPRQRKDSSSLTDAVAAEIPVDTPDRLKIG
jgi:hypothetical protein